MLQIWWVVICFPCTYQPLVHDNFVNNNHNEFCKDVSTRLSKIRIK